MTSVEEQDLMRHLDILQVAASPLERALLGTWCSLACISSLLGNSLLLFATVRHNAVKLDKISAALIKNIAIADLGYSLYIAMTLVSIIANGWVFGDFMCDMANNMHLFFGISEIYLICALNISKLHCLWFPLRSRLREARTGYIIGAAMWMVGPVIYFLPTSVVGRKIVFKLAYYKCENFLQAQTKLVAMVIPIFNSLMLLFLPLLTILVTVTILIGHIRQAAGVSKQSIITLVLISTAYLISYLPFGIYHVLTNAKPEIEAHPAVSLYFYRFANMIIFLNYSANPVIYVLSIKSYKEFVLGSVSKLRNKVVTLSQPSTESSTPSYSKTLQLRGSQKVVKVTALTRSGRVYSTSSLKERSEGSCKKRGSEKSARSIKKNRSSRGSGSNRDDPECAGGSAVAKNPFFEAYNEEDEEVFSPNLVQDTSKSCDT